jgi:uroporphyrin-3 C-methyltransferase
MNTKKTSKRKKKVVAEKAAETSPAEDQAKVEAAAETSPVDDAAKVDAAAETSPVEDQAKVDAAAETSPVEDEAKVEAAAPEQEPEPPTVRPARSGSGVGWLALVIALPALIGTAYLFFDDWRSDGSDDERDTALANLNRTLDDTRQSLSDLERRLDTLAGRDVASVGELQALERKLNERAETFGSLSGRVATLEGAMASVQGISSGARDAWLLGEAEYYMQIANAQLQLAGNPEIASLALGFADERLVQLADPALTEVRRALADELRALNSMEKPDVEGVTLMLASLAGVVDSLPLRQEVESTDPESGAVDPELSGLDRAWASLKRTVGDVISVRRTDQAAAPLTAPDAVYFLRANLALQLQAARLALLRNEQTIFEQSLDDAGAWLNRYYDTETAPVRGALETIAEIRNRLYSVSPPDISGSLRLLRQHVALSGATPPPEVEPD